MLGFEIYPEWATFMHQVFKGCQTSYKSDTIGIKNELEGGDTKWNKLTDILRASLTCYSAKQIGKVLNTFYDHSEKVEILRIKQRFGAPNNLNSMIVNFDYLGKMICELQIVLVCEDKDGLLNQSRQLVTDIENCCDAKDRHMLYQIYSKALFS